MVQILEGTAFNVQKFYDALNHYTNGAKLKACQGGFKWMTLTRQRPTTRIRFRIRSKTKRMIPYSFFGIRVYVPPAGDSRQLFSAADTTNITHVYAHLDAAYNEWHQDYDMKRA